MNLTATMRMLAMSLLLALIVLPAFNISVCAVEEVRDDTLLACFTTPFV